jgi:hypothetical protein
MGRRLIGLKIRQHKGGRDIKDPGSDPGMAGHQ